LSAAPQERFVADLRAGVAELGRRLPDKKLGAVGFCFGGGMVWLLLAAGESRLAAAVPFYGPLPDNADFAGSRAAVLGIYAEQDSRVNATRDAAAGALTRAGLTHEIVTFPGVNHAFFNDTGARYNAGAAATAYQRVLDWFGQHLG
jgi:carboxymethylenebutenolidase